MGMNATFSPQAQYGYRTMSYRIRPALICDQPQLETLIAASARTLSRNVYTEEEIETAITHVFGVDSELVADGTYFIVEQDGEFLACGGWSKRKTLFGGDQFAAREAGLLNPSTDPAKIRAFFVHPDHARKGIGRALLEHCEAAARAHGFTQAEMMATLPGVKLYEACGYKAKPAILHPTPNGKTLRFVPMKKDLPQ